MKIGFLKEWFIGIGNYFTNNGGSWIIIICVLLIIYVSIRLRRGKRLLKTVSFSLPKEIRVSGNTITVNRVNKKLAYNIWVELKTRKISIMFDEETDVIIDVYSSWYAAFGVIREYIKDIGEKSINDYLREVSIYILNEDLRNHLTKYQAKFKKWHDVNYDDNLNLTPQEYQRLYPDYTNLIKDMKKVNTKFEEYLEILEKIYGRKVR